MLLSLSAIIITDNTMVVKGFPYQFSRLSQTRLASSTTLSLTTLQIWLYNTVLTVLNRRDKTLSRTIYMRLLAHPGASFSGCVRIDVLLYCSQIRRLIVKYKSSSFYLPVSQADQADRTGGVSLASMPPHQHILACYSPLKLLYCS